MPVITLFLRDGLFLFFGVLVYTLIEILIWNKGRQTLVEVPINPAIAMHTVLGARILLNIKNLTNKVHDGTISPIQVSTISYPHRLVDAQARIPWYLETGEEHEENLEDWNEEHINLKHIPTQLRKVRTITAATGDNIPQMMVPIPYETTI
ncbi:hypothetical protein DFH08DRAFT_931102 [Mycena albidolilacea]|uniref:Uncharacterized protein n=1 Tax=Mycena albidolilacea TaxID=1033008 RepID=A0AAD7AJD3_9AGAR|nr:hypothetical protein DFH08DRAFT_931102 [Mycena albidolilacea]